MARAVCNTPPNRTWNFSHRNFPPDFSGILVGHAGHYSLRGGGANRFPWFVSDLMRVGHLALDGSRRRVMPGFPRLDEGKERFERIARRPASRASRDQQTSIS